MRKAKYHCASNNMKPEETRRRVKASSLKQLIGTPWVMLACLSLAFCFAARNVFDVSGLISPTQQSFVSIILLQVSRIVPLLVIYWLYRRTTKMSSGFQPILCSHTLRLLCIACLESLGIFFLLYSPQTTIHFFDTVQLDRMFFGIGNSLLLIAIAEFFLRHDRLTALYGLAISIIISSILELAIAIMQVEISSAFQVFMPFIACFFLIEAQRRFQSSTDTAQRVDTEAVNLTPNKKSFRLLLIIIGCYAFIFNSLKATWITESLLLADGILPIRYSSTIGLFISGLLIFAFISADQKDRDAIPVSPILVPLIMASLYLSTFLGDDLSFVYIATLFLARKLLVFLIWGTALLFLKRRLRMRLFTLGVLGLEIGFIVYYFLHQLFSLLSLSETNIIPTIVVILLVIMLSYELSIWFRASKQKTESDPTPDLSTIQSIKNRYHLTSREEDVFILLASGRNAEYIAKRLVIAPTTAKSHIAHIYQKLNINSQQQLMDIMEETEIVVRKEKL